MIKGWENESVSLFTIILYSHLLLYYYCYNGYMATSNYSITYTIRGTEVNNVPALQAQWHRKCQSPPPHQWSARYRHPPLPIMPQVKAVALGTFVQPLRKVAVLALTLHMPTCIWPKLVQFSSWHLTTMGQIKWLHEGAIGCQCLIYRIVVWTGKKRY